MVRTRKRRSHIDAVFFAGSEGCRRRWSAPADMRRVRLLIWSRLAVAIAAN